MEDKIKGKLKRREREERRSNVVRGIGVKKGKSRKAVEGILENIGVKVKVEQVRRIEKELGAGREIASKMGK